jgi:peptidoglycan/xylan/chitin deacetylase (PgdA/CDA1 family)
MSDKSKKQTGIAKTTRLIMASVILSGIGSALGTTMALAKDPVHAVAVMYHRFGENKYPSTNIRLEQFETHLNILSADKFNVVSLDTIVNALKSGTPLPAKTIAITVDDAYASVFTEAWPRMKAKGWPMTVFVATEAVDEKRPGYMTWDQIRTLRDAGVTIGAHTKSHAHLARMDKVDALTEIAASNARFKTELGQVPTLFAYPYGEANSETLELIKRSYVAAFGQHSGVLSSKDNDYYLPRYALNENYGDADRFKLVINTKPLPVTDIVPSNPTLAHNPPTFGFTVTDPALPLNTLNCYGSNPGTTTTEKLGTRIEVRLSDAFTGTRGRINCTVMDRQGTWRWFGQLYYIPENLRTSAVKDD